MAAVGLYVGIATFLRLRPFRPPPPPPPDPVVTRLTELLEEGVKLRGPIRDFPYQGQLPTDVESEEAWMKEVRQTLKGKPWLIDWFNQRPMGFDSGDRKRYLELRMKVENLEKILEAVRTGASQPEPFATAPPTQLPSQPIPPNTPTM
jgi:hypothetical protein